MKHRLMMLVDDESCYSFGLSFCFGVSTIPGDDCQCDKYSGATHRQRDVQRCAFKAYSLYECMCIYAHQFTVKMRQTNSHSFTQKRTYAYVMFVCEQYDLPVKCHILYLKLPPGQRRVNHQIGWLLKVSQLQFLFTFIPLF